MSSKSFTLGSSFYKKRKFHSDRTSNLVLSGKAMIVVSPIDAHRDQDHHGYCIDCRCKITGQQDRALSRNLVDFYVDFKVS